MTIYRNREPSKVMPTFLSHAAEILPEEKIRSAGKDCERISLKYLDPLIQVFVSALLGSKRISQIKTTLSPLGLKMLSSFKHFFLRML